MKQFLAFAFLCASCSCSGQQSNEDLKTMTKDRLESSAMFIIEDGVRLYERGDWSAVTRRLIDQWAVQAYSDPVFKMDGLPLAFIKIKSRGVYYDLLRLGSCEAGGAIYEWWMVQKSAKDWVDEGPEASFLIVKAIDGRREIVISSQMFRESVEAFGNLGCRLPVESLEFRYFLRPWDFPGHFSESDTSTRRVVIGEGGEYAEVESD